ncbi:MAG TPA: alpha/beta fold hydrolase [Solirubrobacteraceae bacterium]|nr:alpha/beta fold hydrolase [Solirubrobacteraceae bacterium]
MTVIPVGEIQLDYERTGAGAPLLMIMGLGGTALHWCDHFLQALRGHFETIVYDHRGVGASSRLDGPVSIRQMADDAVGLLDALGLEEAHVLGISMGGMIAQELALAHPQRILTLTLGCTYCGGPGSALMAPETTRRLADARLSRDRERAIRVSWEVNVSPEFAADEQAWAHFHDVSERRTVALSVIAEQAQAVTAHDTSARLHEIALPTLVIHGSVDQILPVQNGHMVAERIPGARLELFDGVGHLFFWERPQRSAELMLAHAGAYA